MEPSLDPMGLAKLLDVGPLWSRILSMLLRNEAS
jgi:hypothetical protein